MNKTSQFVGIFSFLLLMSSTSSSECRHDSSKRLVDFAQKLNQLKIVGEIWPGFSSSLVPFIVIDSNSSRTCAFVQSERWVGLKELLKPLKAANGSYAFCGGHREEKCSDYFEGLTEGVLWDLASGMDPFAEKFGINADILQVISAVHESFHFLGQEIGPAREFWPAQFDGIDFSTRQEIKAKCYRKSAKIESLVERERRALFTSFESARAKKSWAHINVSLKVFLAARDERYRLLDGDRVHEDGLACAIAESKIEMIEGAPDYAAYKTALDAGLMNDTDLRKIDELLLQAPVPGDFAHYYVAGALELFLIEELEGGVIGFLNRAQINQNLSLTEEIRRLSNGSPLEPSVR